MKLMLRLRRFARASGGLAALEFALLLPMMVLLLFGSMEVMGMLETNRRAQNTTASLADVISRDTEVSNAEIAGIWDATNVLMFPNNGERMQVRISSVRVVDASTARVVWSESHGSFLPPRAPNSVITLPAAMMQPGSSLIFAETVYPYTSPLGLVRSGTITMRHQAYRRSRLVDPIPRVA